MAECQVCATPLVSRAHNALYCGQACRSRARRRRRTSAPTPTPEPEDSNAFAAAVTACLTDLPRGLALLATALADRLDAAAPRDTAALARELRATLADLRALAADQPQEVNAIDAILARRRIAPAG